MRSIYLHIRKLVIRFLAAAALACLAAAPPVVGPAEAPELSIIDQGADQASARPLSLSPGRVAFRLTRAGEWLGLVPGWSDGKDVVTGGGFVVLAVDKSGKVIEIANTAIGGVKAGENSGKQEVVYEGILGGARYPQANSDDDDDGSENEDRLDGIDNDNDGQTDEDFAAVGDEMVSLGYSTSAPLDASNLDFHQECYAWSLPHIDGMVAMKLVVKNTGTEPLQSVRIGTLIDRPGDYTIETQDMNTRSEENRERMSAKGVLLSESGETSVAALFFATPAEKTPETSWLTGVAGKDRSLAGLLSAAIFADETPGTNVSGTPQPQTDQPGIGGASPAKPKNTKTAGRITYGISPNLGTLRPGEEAVVYVALVAIPPAERADQAIENAYRTIIGDGEHRLVPPPMSVTRRTIWGTYRLSQAKEGSAGVTISLENLSVHGFEKDNISYLEGIDLENAIIKESFSGIIEITLMGESPELFSGENNRVVVRGRLLQGEFFDVILRRASGGPDSQPTSGQNADMYWSTAGKLDETYLTGSPNPFKESTTIFYEVPSQMSDEESGLLRFINPIQTSVKVYNVAGRLVNVLVDAVLAPGVYNTQWNGMDDNGSGVASGVYYVKLQIGKRHVTKRLIQLK